jgi:hypothetical protein
MATMLSYLTKGSNSKKPTEDKTTQDIVPDTQTKGTEEEELQVTEIDGAPKNLDKSGRRWIQPWDKCGAGHFCKATVEEASDLSVNHRCNICQWCTHRGCSIEIRRSRTQQKQNSPVLPKFGRAICLRCVNSNSFEKKIHTDKDSEKSYIPTAHKQVLGILREELVTLSLSRYLEDVSDYDGNDGNEDSDDESDDDDDVDLEAIVVNGKTTMAETNKSPSSAPHKKQQKKQQKKKDTSINTLKTTQEHDPKKDKNGDNISEANKTLEGTPPAAADVTALTPADEETLNEQGNDDDTICADNGPTPNPEEMTGITIDGGTSVATEAETMKYIDIQLNIDSAGAAAKPKEVADMLVAKCKEWFETIQTFNESFKLHTADPKENQLVCHHKKDFPKTVADIKNFFKGARPKPQGGRLYMKVKASFNGPVSRLLSEVDWYHRQNKELIRVASIQAYEVTILGSMLYSLRTMNSDTLQDIYAKACKKEVSLRWMRIPDGKPYEAGRDMSEEPKSYHIECASDDQGAVEAYMKRTYHSNATVFPLHIRMRFVPSVQRLMDVESTAKFNMLRNRQGGWCKQAKAKMRDDIVEVDHPISGLKGITIRDLVMQFKSTTGNTDTPLFASIDKKWKGAGFNFTFHPAKAIEAEIVMRGIYPRLVHHHGETIINPFFTHTAIKNGRSMQYDPVTHRVKSEADDAISLLTEADPDMAFFMEDTEMKEAEAFGQRADIFVKERTDDDSVSTFQPKRHAPPDEITAQKAKKKAKKSDNTTTDDSTATGSTASSLSITTKHTFDSRISSIEGRFSSIQGDMNTNFAMMATAIAAINSKLGPPPEAVNPVSPESVKTNSHPPANTSSSPAGSKEGMDIPGVSREAPGVS